jgi:hypothetical protein
MRWVSGMAASAALAFAGPAAAVTLVFDVNVTSAQGILGFTPFSFQQTWTFGPGTATPYATSTRVGHAVTGAISATAPPDGFNAGAHPLASFGALTTTAGYDFKTGADFSTFGRFASLDAFEQDQLVIALGGSQIVRYHKVTLGVARTASFSTTPPYAASEHGLAAFLASGPIAWRDEAGERFGNFDPSRRVYVGTMTLAPPPESAVPEPASWALMIAGFGGVGAVVRRRRPTLTAAGCSGRS